MDRRGFMKNAGVGALAVGTIVAGAPAVHAAKEV